MAMKSIHEYLADALIKEVSVFGKAVGGERIAKSLKFWEETYGSAIADKARKLITADWRKRFKARGSGLGPSHSGGGTDGQNQGNPEVLPDEVVQPEGHDVEPAARESTESSKPETQRPRSAQGTGRQIGGAKHGERDPRKASRERVQVEVT